ncbi:uncharacterized protein SCHCODRAFT_02672886 [Schizophyllum commune H4-8]|uniref:G-protein coupled receptors family 1 profile domain-containing protein n=1 Tax=Schizophyllum commune (strain H4-8 / FGSC 9210) TaxID=578458 RepID=D8QJ24_SCHCM|nr:uncharacterized protein SCHCODRAFT_02672886 [Schizophyllum commune H4-8]KAI5885795.1 hypothetical protein SCHCODRAFT_02672886 [Schizophyllum commune H4-8]
MITTITMFALSCACLLLDALNTMSLLEGVLLETRGEVQHPVAWISRQSANDRAFAQAAIFAFELIISDGVVVWRGAALWGYNWRCSTIMLLPLFGDLAQAVYVYFLACEGQSKWLYIDGMQAKHCHDSQRAMYFFSFSTNLLATGFIIAMAWQHRGAFEVRKATLSGSGRPRRTAAQKVMLLLIESGFVYLIMGAASGFTFFLVVQDLSSPGYFVTTVFVSLRYQIVGLYPTTVIYLVQREQTNWCIPATDESLHFKGITQEDTTVCPTTRSYNLTVNKCDNEAGPDAIAINISTGSSSGNASGCNPVSTRPPLVSDLHCEPNTVHVVATNGSSESMTNAALSVSGDCLV